MKEIMIIHKIQLVMRVIRILNTINNLIDNVNSKDWDLKVKMIE